MTNFENLDPTGNNRNSASAKSKSSTIALIIGALALLIGGFILLSGDWGSDSRVSQTSTVEPEPFQTTGNAPEITPTPAPAAPASNP